MENTAKALDIPVIEHCEDLNLSAGGDMHEGLDSVRLGLRGIPSASEDVMVARDILLAELTGARYHVAHISTKNAVGMVEFAKRRGLAVTCEATQHHIALDTGHMKPYDSNYKMKPPLRCLYDVEAVVEGIVRGAVDCLATDHAPHAGATTRCRSLSAARSGSSDWRRHWAYRWRCWCTPGGLGCRS